MELYIQKANVEPSLEDGVAYRLFLANQLVKVQLMPAFSLEPPEGAMVTLCMASY